MGRFLTLLLASVCGGLIQGTCGFGCGILAMLGLSAFLPVNQSAAVTSIINFGITVPMVLRYRRHLTFRKIIIPFLIYTLCSILIIRISADLEARMLKRVFGGFLVMLSIYHFTLAGKQPGKWTPILALLAFIISGVGSGLFAVGGPMMVLYFLGNTDSKEEFLADTQMIFVLNAMPTLYTRISSGLLTAEHLPFLVPGLIGVLGGFWIAGRIVKTINKEKLTAIVYSVICICGVLFLTGM